MSYFHLYTSNRLEHLALLLSTVLAVPQDPMRPQTVLVQSGGMQRWVTMRLAREHGIVANVRFPFPVHFAHYLCSRLVRDVPEEYALAQQRMVWRIVRVLPDVLALPEFAPVAAYLHEASDLKRVQFAQRVAYLFDLYVQFRPEWAACWEQGRTCAELRRPEDLLTESWQARLWREIVSGHEQEHRAALVRRTLDALERDVPPEALPEQVAVFGISTLPPAYLDVLLAVARHVPVHMFLLSPCRHYWGDVSVQREQRRDYRRLVNEGLTREERPEDRLPLASLGALGRDFHEALLERGVEELPVFRPHDAPASLLEWMQADILEAGALETDSGEGWPENQALRVVPAGDQSVRVHCCHSPLREMEVLRDVLLDLLETDPTLEPRDILVMNPSIEDYAPFIHAVFATSEDGRQALPYAISDRRPSSTGAVTRLFLELLTVEQQRFEASWVCALLESPPLREVLDLGEAECAQIVAWVREAGIRWGADGGFRAAHGLPGDGRNTWRSGLERLFMGYMTGPRREPLLGIAPVGPVGSVDQDVLGRVAHCIEQLHALWAELRTPATAAVWQERLLGITTCFFPQTGPLAEGVLTIRQSIMALIEDMTASGLSTVVDCATMRHVLRGRLDEAPAESGFLSAGVTFCGLRPMRAIPFRVICLTGLSSAAFPRQDPHLGFDLLTAAPRRGDRSQREDDRYLFLESLISVRERLILTYPGLSADDNSLAPPSVLVAELLDYLDGRFRLDGALPTEALVTRHRLQAFHPDYFTAGSGLFSYCAYNRAGAEALLEPARDGAAFTAPRRNDGEMNAGAAALQDVDLDELIAFLGHPARHLLRVLSIQPTRGEEDIADEEPLATPRGIEGYAVRDRLLTAALEHEALPLEDMLGAWHVVPLGPAGQDAAREVCASVRAVAAKVCELRGACEPVVRDVRVDLGAWRVHGRLTLHGEQMIACRPARVKGADMLRVWMWQVLAGICGVRAQAVHVGLDETFVPPPPENPRAVLEDMLALYAQGGREAVPLFPRASLEYATRRFLRHDAPETALARALGQWTGGFACEPEQEDASIALVYRERDPDWSHFMAVTERVYGPMLEDGYDA